MVGNNWALSWIFVFLNYMLRILSMDVDPLKAQHLNYTKLSTETSKAQGPIVEFGTLCNARTNYVFWAKQLGLDQGSWITLKMSAKKELHFFSHKIETPQDPAAITFESSYIGFIKNETDLIGDVWIPQNYTCKITSMVSTLDICCKNQHLEPTQVYHHDEACKGSLGMDDWAVECGQERIRFNLKITFMSHPAACTHSGHTHKIYFFSVRDRSGKTAKLRSRRPLRSLNVSRSWTFWCRRRIPRW